MSRAGLRVLSVAEVCSLLGVSRATLARWQQSGAFPARRQLSRGRVGWPSATVELWIAAVPPAPGTAEACGLAEKAHQ